MIERVKQAPRDGLPSRGAHWVIERRRRMAATVAENSRRGMWSRINTSTRKQSLYQQGTRMKGQPEWAEHGEYALEYRWRKWQRHYELWMIYPDLAPDTIVPIDPVDDSPVAPLPGVETRLTDMLAAQIEAYAEMQARLAADEEARLQREREAEQARIDAETYRGLAEHERLRRRV